MPDVTAGYEWFTIGFYNDMQSVKKPKIKKTNENWPIDEKVQTNDWPKKIRAHNFGFFIKKFIRKILYYKFIE